MQNIVLFQNVKDSDYLIYILLYVQTQTALIMDYPYSTVYVLMDDSNMTSASRFCDVRDTCNYFKSAHLSECTLDNCEPQMAWTHVKCKIKSLSPAVSVIQVLLARDKANRILNPGRKRWQC